MVSVISDGKPALIPLSHLTLWILRTNTDAKNRNVPLSSSTEDSSSVIFLQCCKACHVRKQNKIHYINPTTIHLALLKTEMKTFSSDSSTGSYWNESYQVWAESKQSSIQVQHAAFPVCLCTEQWLKKYVSKLELYTNSCSNILSAWFWPSKFNSVCT